MSLEQKIELLSKEVEVLTAAIKQLSVSFASAEFPALTQQLQAEAKTEKTASTKETGTVVQIDVEPSKTKRRGRPAKKVETPVEENETEEESVEVEEASNDTEEKAIGLEDVRAALVAFSKSHGKDKAREVLESFNAVKISDVKKEDYRDVLDAILDMRSAA